MSRRSGRSFKSPDRCAAPGCPAAGDWRPLFSVPVVGGPARQVVQFDASIGFCPAHRDRFRVADLFDDGEGWPKLAEAFRAKGLRVPRRDDIRVSFLPVRRL